MNNQAQLAKNIPTVFVVFGATGDLMAKKIAPAMFHLFEKLRLPKLDQQKLTQFLKLFSYQQGFFDNKGDYEKLAKSLGGIDGAWKVCSNKLFYLAKEMVQNILAFRFSNNLFEKTWDKDSIEKIEIKLWEKIGVDDRGSFYDDLGALRDVGQNHLLQILALLTMNHPINFSAQSIREKRAEILKNLIPPFLPQRATLKKNWSLSKALMGWWLFQHQAKNMPQ